MTNSRPEDPELSKWAEEQKRLSKQREIERAQAYAQSKELKGNLNLDLALDSIIEQTRETLENLESLRAYLRKQAMTPEVLGLLDPDKILPVDSYLEKENMFTEYEGGVVGYTEGSRFTDEEVRETVRKVLNEGK